MNGENDWLRCADALTLARNLSGSSDQPEVRGHPTHAALFYLAAEGMIRTIATTMRHYLKCKNRFEETNSDASFILRLISEAELNSGSRWVGRGTDVDYLFDVGLYDYHSGAFSFGDQFSDEKYVAIGLKFSRSDIFRLLGNQADEDGSLSVAAPLVSKTNAEKECERWLIEQFTGLSDLSKEELWELCRAKFGNRLSRNGFTWSWANATSDFPVRRRPGRKST